MSTPNPGGAAAAAKQCRTRTVLQVTATALFFTGLGLLGTSILYDSGPQRRRRAARLGFLLGALTAWFGSALMTAVVQLKFVPGAGGGVPPPAMRATFSTQRPAPTSLRQAPGPPLPPPPLAGAVRDPTAPAPHAVAHQWAPTQPETAATRGAVQQGAHIRAATMEDGVREPNSAVGTSDWAGGAAPPLPHVTVDARVHHLPAMRSGPARGGSAQQARVARASAGARRNARRPDAMPGREPGSVLPVGSTPHVVREYQPLPAAADEHLSTIERRKRWIELMSQQTPQQLWAARDADIREARLSTGIVESEYERVVGFVEPAP